MPMFRKLASMLISDKISDDKVYNQVLNLSLNPDVHHVTFRDP